MANRLVSLNDCIDFISGGTAISEGDRTALGIVLDGVSVRVEQEVLGHQLVGEMADGLKQVSAVGRYGPEDYGLDFKDVLLLRRFLNVSSVASIDNDGSTLNAADYVVDTSVGAVRLLAGRFASNPKSVAVTYTAGYAETGTGDARRLQIPNDLRLGVLEQITWEWSKRQPGSGGIGAISVSTPGGSVVSQEIDYVLPMRRLLKRYQLRRTF